MAIHGGQRNSATLEFPALLRALRERACLTQEELAERSGLSIRAISDLERGRTTKPHRKSVALLAQALQIEGESLERFRRIARGNVGSRSLWTVPLLSTTAPRSAMSSDRPSAHGHQQGVSQLVEWMRHVLVDEPAPAGGGTGGGPAMPRVLELVAAPGASVTNAVVQAAARFRRHFPDGQFYVNATGGLRESAGLVARLARVLGVEAPAHAAPENRAGRLREALRTRRALLVIDNVVEAEQVRPVLTSRGGCSVIVISQRPLGLLEGVWTLDLPLCDGDALPSRHPVAPAKTG